MTERRRYIVITFPDGSEELFTTLSAVTKSHPFLRPTTMMDKFKLASKTRGYGAYSSDEIWYKGCHIRRLWVNDKLIADANNEN